MPRILAVDTALGACSAALLEGDAVLARRFEAMARGHAEALAPMVADVMRGHDYVSLDRLAVTTGPGTFTGQRIGLAFMRGLRVALDLPLNGIVTLRAIAAAAMDGARGSCIVLHDARRDEVYAALYEDGREKRMPCVMALDDAVAFAASHPGAVLAGTAAQSVAASLPSARIVSAIAQPDALWVARLALADAPATDAPAPLYLRAPDAKLPANPALLP